MDRLEADGRSKMEDGLPRSERLEVRQRLLSLASARQGEATLCPSEVARSLSDDWRVLMPAVREVADELITEGVMECTQRGRVISSAVLAKGPIRLRLRRVSSAD